MLRLRRREARGAHLPVYEVAHGEAFRSVGVLAPLELIRMETW